MKRVYVNLIFIVVLAALAAVIVFWTSNQPPQIQKLVYKQDKEGSPKMEALNRERFSITHDASYIFTPIGKDPNGDKVNYVWDFKGPKSFVKHYTGDEFKISFDATGISKLTLTANDFFNAKDTNTFIIEVK